MCIDVLDLYYESITKEIVLRIQSNYNGSNTFGTMTICSRQGLFELMTVNRSTRTECKVEISFCFSNMNVYCVFSLELPHRGDSN